MGRLHLARPPRRDAGILLASCGIMATLTIRNVPPRVVSALKNQAKRHNRSMEQEVRALLESAVADRASVLQQVREAWTRQARRPDAREIQSWLDASRP